MFILLITIILILAVLLILVILGQNSKGGVGAAFGGGASQIMGVTRTGNVLEKATWVLAVSILALSLASSAFYNGAQSNQFSSPNIENAKQQVVAPTFGEGESLLPAATEETSAEPDTTSGN
ncbi:preprotein translocase subunit SecG [Algoriphagus sp. D3-2-R+10]|uniref:preprotein translocase subunit SecG n=1 Tax=Algoriphagus aurantiacus TaxID=3103948 RepID=UPI002B3D6DD9|nr:preprotein translocase subunit SecG [Algoriphagus sp. D3-2-R+10]MEB2777593.1 preprotein translocase subunit SecG [Algoriphagus sp. D3-2-R+10]